MKLVGRLISAMVVLSAVVALCPGANAGAFTYAGKRKRIYCGVAQLVHTGLDTNKNPVTVWTGTNKDAIDAMADPNASDKFGYYGLLFAKLDALTSMKPLGWSFENPLAATEDKTDPRYWLVNVASSRNLDRLNVLYFPGSGVITLTAEERENLRRFVDNGGVLWIDNAGGGGSAGAALTFDTNSPFFITQVGFAPGGLGSDVPVSRHHPLVSSPYWLTDIDIMSLGMGVTGSAWSRCHYDMPVSSISTQPQSFDFLYQVIDGANQTSGAFEKQPSVVANAYGSGAVVATANFVGKACLLREPYSLPSLKMAYNIMSYGSSWTDIRKNPRHTGSSLDTLGSNRLVEKWSMLSGAPDDAKETAPVIYKNTVFYSKGNTLYAMDANGNNNYGLWGPLGPNGEAVIWTWEAPGKLSAPAVATMQNPDQGAPDCDPDEFVMVMDDAGTVYVLKAFPLDANGLVMSPIAPVYTYGTEGPASGASGTSGLGTSKWPSPPIYINGWIYSLGGAGRLFARNPCLQKWSATSGGGSGGSGGSTTATDIYKFMIPDASVTYKSDPRCGPAFAYMKGIYSGAIVGAVSWYDGPDTSGATTTAPDSQNDHLWAIPVTVSNDRVKIQSTNSTRTVAELVCNFPGWIVPLDETHKEKTVSVYDTDGVTEIPITDIKLNENMGGTTVPGYMVITTARAISSNPRMYATYMLKYDKQTAMIRMDMEIEPKIPITTGGASGGAITHNQSIVGGSPAIGPDNMLYMCAQRDSKTTARSDGGSILAYSVDGSTSGSAKLKWHYFLHSGLDATTSGQYAPGTNVEIPGVIRDKTSNLSMLNPQPSSSPAVANGKVFVTVSGEAGSGNPRGAVLCLKANPEFIIRITSNAGYTTSGAPNRQAKSLYRQGDEGHYHVRIWQPNLINDPTGAVPMMDARDVSGGARVDYDNGTITFSDFSQPKLQIRGGVETNTFSPSLPVWVYLDNVEVPIDWSTWGPGASVGSTPITPATSDAVDLSGWNNLLWYYIIPDYNGQPCTGAHSPPTVIGNTLYFVTDDGILYALDTETGESKSQQTTQKALWVQKLGTSSSGLTEKNPVSVAGSDGVLVVPGADGLHAYTSQNTLLADNNRLLELDGAGDVAWSCDSITWPANTPSATGVQMAVKQGPINKPGRARYASTGEILFANSGADQVCKIDKSGMVGFDGASGLYARWIYDKFADPRHLLSTGQPTKLSGPTDAIMWQEIEPKPSTTAPATSVVHCLIVDSGNSRILDLVYRVRAGSFVKWDGTNIDPNNPSDVQEYKDRDSGFVMPELNWVSKTDALNEKYSYNCLQLVNAVKNGKYCQDVWVASSDIASTGTDLGGTSPMGVAGTGGAIMAIAYRERSNGSQTAAPGDWSYDITDAKGNDVSGAVVARCDHVIMGSKSVPIANPRYFEVVDDPIGGRFLLICDNNGVYDATISSGPPTVQHHLRLEDYPLLHRIEDPTGASTTGVALPGTPPLIASSVQRLPNHKWLITNSYAGTCAGSPQGFNGEVFEYDPEGGAGQEVLWCSPKLEWVSPVAPATMPTVWRQSDTNTYNLRQPKSAMRQ